MKIAKTARVFLRGTEKTQWLEWILGQVSLDFRPSSTITNCITLGKLVSKAQLPHL